MISVTPAVDADEPNPGPADPSEPVRRKFPAALLAAGMLFLATVAQHPQPAFYWDAAGYWSGSQSLFDGSSPYVEGVLRLRGVLTPAVYAPAAWIDTLFEGSGGLAVLIENSLIVALLGALLLPRLARLAGARGAWLPWLCSALVWLVTARFAPYPLMDLPTAALFLGAVVLAVRRPLWSVTLAGLCVGAAVNLRPAYLAPAVVLLAATLVFQRFRAAAFVGGLMLGLLPQVWLNLSRNDGLSFVPPDTDKIAGLQSSLSAYVVRYDTIIIGGPPSQLYCDGGMARAVVRHPVSSMSDFALAMVTNPSESVVFLLKKLSATLAWGSYTPYAAPAAIDDSNLILPLAAMTVGGLAVLLLLIRRPLATGTRRHPVLYAALALSICVSVMAAAAETRFALPLVLLGIVGCACGPAVLRDLDRRLVLRWTAATAVGVLLVAVFATRGLSEPMAPGTVGNARNCAAARP
jgi:hypothetical protein